MKLRFLNFYYHFSGGIFELKKRLVEKQSFRQTFLDAVLLIFAELLFIVISLPLFLLVPPDKVLETGVVFPQKDVVVSGYAVRRRISLMTLVGAGGVFVVKLVFLGITSFYLLGVTPLLAASQNWPFDTAGNYVYNSSKIEVTGGVAQLKNLTLPVFGGTTNGGFDAGSTGWIAVPGWVTAPGKTNTATYQAAGGNPGGYVDINLVGKKDNSSGGYWYQPFTVTTSNPTTATLNLDWEALSVTGSPASYHLYAFIGTTSGNPTIGGATQVWDSGEISSSTSWASTGSIDITPYLTAVGTYYLKIAAYHTCVKATDCSTLSGFDNVSVAWTGIGTPSYDTSKPTIYPTTSLNAPLVTTWDSFTETATKNGGEIYYQLSDNDGSTWQYWNDTAWTAAGGSNYNTASVINANINSFPATSKKILWKAFLESNGTQQVILDNIDISYTENDLPDVLNLAAAQNSANGAVYVAYDLQDAESDPSSLVTFKYSLTGAFTGEEAVMTPLASDPNHDGVTGLSSSPSGTAHTFVWDAFSDLGAIYDGTVYVRLQANDGIGSGLAATSSSFAVDLVAPVVSNVSAAQTLGTTDVEITYDLTDNTTTDLLVEIDISEDSGATWEVVDMSVIGDVGSGVSTGVGNSIIWAAGTDFDEQDQNDLRVRVRATDKYQNAGSNVESSDFSVETVNPVVNTTANLQAQPNAGDTSVLVGGSFVENNPDTNDFYVALNGEAYSGATSGDADTAAPSNQNTDVGATLDGNDYISAVKITHTDDFGQSTDNENLSPATAYKYVKPYTPQAPSLSNPITTRLDLNIVAHAGEATDLQYTIFETTTGSYVQTDGTLGATPVWRTPAAWGTVTVNGLSSPVSQYIFQVKSRNPSDSAHATSSESAWSATAQITNTAPAISFSSVAQTSDGSQYTQVNYLGSDGQGDLNNLTVYEYSSDNVNWYAMNEKSGVGSEGISDLVFLPGGSARTFAWNSGSDLAGVEDSTVYVRLRSTDTLLDSNLATSSSCEIDNVAPIVSNVSASQNAGARTVTISYDLSDANNSLVEVEISEDSGAIWNVADTSVSGDVGLGVVPGAGQSITWNAGADFDDQYQNDLRVRVRAKDVFGNQGANAESADFTLDTHDPVISNVYAEQGAGTDVFTFSYDVSEDQGNVDVLLEISNDGGGSWSVPIASASGDFGADIVPGTGKTITWNAASDYSGHEELDMRIRLTAEDSFSNTQAVSSSNFDLDTLAPRVTAVSAVQTLGSTEVSITYTLAEQSSSLVEIDISEDSGASWNVADISVSGDVGSGVTSGSKTITWAAGTDFDEEEQNDLRVRLRAKDVFEHQGANVASADFVLDTLNPTTNVLADLQAQPNAGDTTVLIGGSFVESNPDTNDFYLALNGEAFSLATTGDNNTATPADQNTAVGATLDGNDYISAVKITHTDDFGQIVDNENTSPATAYKFVKPYTPDFPIVDNPTVGTVDVTIVKNSAETDGLDYAIYEVTQDKYVQLDGTLGAGLVWQSDSAWGTITVNGLTNHSYTYEFKVKSRNPSDSAHAASSESAWSGGASSDNQSPVIVFDSVAQTTDGSQYVTINYTGFDLESENSNIITAEYSTDESSWSTMTEKSGVGSDGTTSLVFTNTGVAHDFMWDLATDLPNTEDATVYVRLQAYDGTSSGALTTSSAFVIDTKAPVISTITANQVSDSNNVSFSYTLNDLSTSSVELDISEDSGTSWTVPDTSAFGDIGAGISPGVGKSVVWSAGVDFDSQEQSDMRVRFRALDAFGNQGVYASSVDFDLDTKDPVVTNVAAVQDAGAGTVTITYDFSDANNSTIEIDISEDSGATWGVADTSVSGDIGAGIAPGVGKTISWNAAWDFPNREESDLRVRIRAIDDFANVSGYTESSDFSVDTYAPVISAVSAVQTLASENVVITYNLADSAAVNIAIDISEDSGATWTVAKTTAVGDLGAGVIPGLGKTITWNAGVDFDLEDQADMRVRVRGIDSFNNSSGNIESSDFLVDTLAPSANVTADLQAQPVAGSSLALIGGSFNENNPNTNNFYVAINGGAYGAATAGEGNAATPVDQNTDVGAVLDGSDYISKVKIEHTDDYGHSATNENSAPSVSLKFVKPYTPPAPGVSNPQNTSVDVAVNENLVEAAGLQYAIFEDSTGLYVQLDGTLDTDAIWRTAATWGTVTVNGLTSPVAQYQFRTKSRNSSDVAHATSSESELSAVGAIENTAPSIAITSAGQVGSENYALITYTGLDTQNDTVNLINYEYSTNAVTWSTMTERAGVGSDGVNDLLFASTGATFTFGWDLSVDLPNTADSTVYVRLRASDTLASGNLATSSAFAIDTLGPVISDISVAQTAGSNVFNINYTLDDDSVSGNFVELAISSDGGLTWDVSTTSASGHLGAGVAAGTNRLIVWDAEVDFDDEEQADMRVRLRGTDEYNNVGDYAESNNFLLDTSGPTISGVVAAQVIGSGDISVDYVLADLSAGGLNVEFEGSDDSGVSWTVAAPSYSGNIGSGQVTGSNNFVWNAGADFTDHYEIGMRIRLRASDYYGNLGTYVSSADFELDTKAPTLANPSALQDNGTDNISLGYDLADDTTSDLTVSIDISEDGGVSWTVSDAVVTGDIGSGVLAGVGNLIIWDAGEDFGGQEQSDMRFRIKASDNFGNESSYLESANFSVDSRAPQGLADLAKFSSTETSVTLSWTPATDANFTHYELWYGQNQADVIARGGTASEWNELDDTTLASALTNSTVISGITLDTDLYVKIWAVDDFGHETTLDEINVYEAPTEPETSTTGGGGGAAPIISDTTAPVAPILTPLVSPTNNSSIIISGLSEPRSFVDLYDNGNFVARLTSLADNDGVFEQRFSFDEGVHNLVVRAIDSAGNASEFSTTVNLVIDTIAPVTPRFLNADNQEITDPTPIILGRSEPGTTVELTLDNTTVFEVLADADGSWIFQIPNSNALDLGTHTFTAIATDTAFNSSELVYLSLGVKEAPVITIPPVTILPTAPEIAPGITAPGVIVEPTPVEEVVREVAEAIELPGLESPKIISSASLARNNSIVLAGTAEPNQDVIVYVHSQSLIYQTKADAQGDWVVEHSQDQAELAPGEHTVFAVAVDPENGVKTAPGPVSVFTVKKNLWVEAFNLLNFQTTLVTLVVMLVAVLLLYRTKRRSKQLP